ncbi:MAG TPA: hypothetical protein PLT03_01700 [Bacillota bacterium]|mgnify:CR=1 FL=1|nr:hypothetical protein [Bacillota bacterium]HOG52568.1 hypothetical protein [Bacillota bacterium]
MRFPFTRSFVTAVLIGTILLSSVFIQAAASDPAPGITGTPVIVEEFENGLSSMWATLGYSGGDFQKFAKVENGQLVVSVPKGNGAGRTGIMSAEPLFKVNAAMKDDPVRIVIEFDQANTDNFVVALSAVKDQNAWKLPNLWVFWNRISGTDRSHFGISSIQGEGDYRTNSEKSGRPVPRYLMLTIWPGRVELKDLETNERFDGSYTWLKEGAAPYLFVFANPIMQGNAAKMAVKSIRVYGALK